MLKFSHNTWHLIFLRGKNAPFGIIHLFVYLIISFLLSCPECLLSINLFVCLLHPNHSLPSLLTSCPSMHSSSLSLQKREAEYLSHWTLKQVCPSPWETSATHRGAAAATRGGCVWFVWSSRETKTILSMLISGTRPGSRSVKPPLPSTLLEVCEFLAMVSWTSWKMMSWWLPQVFTASVFLKPRNGRCLK